jgi:hypothetical protein
MSHFFKKFMIYTIIWTISLTFIKVNVIHHHMDDNFKYLLKK